jgi:hypothetical protein
MGGDGQQGKEGGDFHAIALTVGKLIIQINRRRKETGGFFTETLPMNEVGH